MTKYFNEPKCKMFQCGFCGFFTLYSEAMDKHLMKVHEQTGVFDFEY